jgi:hypothetical protein
MLSDGMVEQSNATSQAGAFISHINPESPIAIVLQEYLGKAYPDNFPVFVSSDKKSIPGGTGWWQHIRDSIRERQVVIVLVSDESVSEEWINFEAGVGDGSGAKIIPVAITNYRFDRLDFPLKGFQGRYVGDLEGILYDIDQWTKRAAAAVDKAAYLHAMRKAEESVTYKSLLIRPVRTTFNGLPNLMFEIENKGNVDVDLLFIEVQLPRHILASGWNMQEAPPTLEVDYAGDRLLSRYYSIHNTVRPYVRRLEPTITRSMGVRRLHDLRFPLKAEGDGPDPEAVIRYQIHGRDIDTEPEELRLCEIPDMAPKCE